MPLALWKPGLARTIRCGICAVGQKWVCQGLRRVDQMVEFSLSVCLLLLLPGYFLR